jgi:hypothetical protein
VEMDLELLEYWKGLRGKLTASRRNLHILYTTARLCSAEVQADAPKVI